MEPPLLQNPFGHSGDSSGQGERLRPWSPQRKSIIESERSRKMVELLLNKGCKVCASVRVLRERYGSRTHMRLRCPPAGGSLGRLAGAPRPELPADALDCARWVQPELCIIRGLDAREGCAAGCVSGRMQRQWRHPPRG